MNDTFKSIRSLATPSGKFSYYSLSALEKAGLGPVSRLPISMKVMVEAVLRNVDGKLVTEDDLRHIAAYNPKNVGQIEVPFMPARVLMQDFTGVPAIVDLAAMRSAMARMGGDPQRINPLIPVDLVIDHSIQVDSFGVHESLQLNSDLEFERNRERYEFLHWGQQAFRNFRVVPPASGICHQVNLEYLGVVVQRKAENGTAMLYPDSLVGTDSHTTMINGLGIVGWGVGGIEAEATMLGQPLYMLAPETIGFKLTGKMPPGATATDLVLTATQMLRKKGVVNKFVEYFGEGLDGMTVPDRATLANMAPEYGATIGFFPVDSQTLDYMRYTGRSAELIGLTERYCKEQGLWRDSVPDLIFTDTLELDLSTIEPSLAGPTRPQDRTSLKNLKKSWRESLSAPKDKRGFDVNGEAINKTVQIAYPDGVKGDFHHGDIAIAAITSCTNTSNPSVLIGAGLLAKKAIAAGLKPKPYVKTSLAPGSKVVTDYLEKSGLLKPLEDLGFNVVGYGCTTCIGNSGPLPDHIGGPIKSAGIIAASVLSGNRNFTGRIHPLTKASYLASPPLVVAFALAGTVDRDLSTEPIGEGHGGKPVYLRDIWPTLEEINAELKFARDPATFKRAYDGIEKSNPTWNAIPAEGGAAYDWKEDSTYIQEPPFFIGMTREPGSVPAIRGARVLVKAGDSVTTDHISPAGNIASDSPAGVFLVEHIISPRDFNSYGSRRGNDRVMTRGTFANITFRNALGQGREGGWTTHYPSGELTTIYDASLRYAKERVPTIILAGVDYGMGSSRDWAAKGTVLLGVKAVIAQSFERIHRSNLVGMGVLPLVFKPGDSAESLGLDGSESYDVKLPAALKPGQTVPVEVISNDGKRRSFDAISRLDSSVDIEYYQNGGILQTVLRGFLKA